MSCAKKVGNTGNVDPCSNGIKDGTETGIDCGGNCSTCPPNLLCEDGIKNQGETGIDCGGECLSCIPTNPITHVADSAVVYGFGCNGCRTSSRLYKVTTDSTLGNSSNFKTKIFTSFPFSNDTMFCTISFYKKSFINIPLNSVQVFNADTTQTNKVNKCFISAFYKRSNNFNSSVISLQNVYVKRLNINQYNLQFYNLSTYMANGLHGNISISLNTNFSF